MVQAQGSAANWYIGITWAHRTRWRNDSVVKWQYQSFGRVVDLMRLWALFKSRGKQEIAGFYPNCTSEVGFNLGTDLEIW